MVAWTSSEKAGAALGPPLGLLAGAQGPICATPALLVDQESVVDGNLFLQP